MNQEDQKLTKIEIIKYCLIKRHYTTINKNKVSMTSNFEKPSAVSLCMHDILLPWHPNKFLVKHKRSLTRINSTNSFILAL